MEDKDPVYRSRGQLDYNLWCNHGIGLNIAVSAPEGLNIPPMNHITPTMRLILVFLSYSGASFIAEISCPGTRSGNRYWNTSIWNNEMWLFILYKTMDAIAYSCPNPKHFNLSTHSAAEYMNICIRELGRLFGTKPLPESMLTHC